MNFVEDNTISQRQKLCMPTSLNVTTLPRVINITLVTVYEPVITPTTSGFGFAS